MSWTARLSVVMLGATAAAGLACPGPAPTGPRPGLPPITTPPGATTDAAPPEVTTERACEDLLAHAIELLIKEGPAGTAAPTPAERAALDAELRSEYLAECRTLPPTLVRCGLRATTPAALTACQETPSSSTSNSNVEPPGITPPAPAAP